MELSEKVRVLGEKAENDIKPYFESIEKTALKNTEKVLDSFKKNRISESHFNFSSGYGYGDRGRDALDIVYADVFEAEKALVRTSFVNGTHAITSALFAALMPGDRLLSATGGVYDTLKTVIGITKGGVGTLFDYGISYDEAPLLKSGLPDLNAVREKAADKKVKAVFIQRSKGYSERESLAVEEISKIVCEVKRVNDNACIVVDNCYGEFVEEHEPCFAGADIVAGSLIKNPGRGLALTGGYVAGKKKLVEAAAARLTAPGIGGECGISLGHNRSLYQGLFLAPHTVSQALKTAVFCARVMELSGFKVFPPASQKRYDIIQTVNFSDENMLLSFMNGIQSASPVDSFLTPEPWDMPGYDSKVVMAAGTFIQGASIELSCDAPMRKPYTAYLQGGLTYESGKLGILLALEKILNGN